jgi:hypothetical protein
VVLSATTFGWKNDHQSLNPLTEDRLAGKITPLPGLIDVLRELATQTLIHLKIQHYPSAPASLLSRPNLATLHNRGKPPGRSSPPTCRDFSLLGHIVPDPSSRLWLTDVLRFSGGLSSSPSLAIFPHGFCKSRSIRELSRTPQYYPSSHLIAPKRNPTTPCFGCFSGGK